MCVHDWSLICLWHHLRNLFSSQKIFFFILWQNLKVDFDWFTTELQLHVLSRLPHLQFKSLVSISKLVRAILTPSFIRIVYIVCTLQRHYILCQLIHLKGLVFKIVGIICMNIHNSIAMKKLINILHNNYWKLVTICMVDLVNRFISRWHSKLFLEKST